MQKYIKYYLLIIVSLSGCDSDYLDITPPDRITQDQVWSDPALVALYVNGLYDAIPHGLERHMWTKLTDEAYGNSNWLTGRVTPDNIADFGEAYNWVDYYERGYQYIRQCNVFFNNIDSSPMNEDEKAALTAQVHFIRAFTYAQLLWRYGGVPIVEGVYSLEDDESFSREDYQVVFDYIIDELNMAQPDLPEQYPANDANFGRATQHAVMALQSRLYLYDASLLNNPSNDRAKWTRAAEAAKAVIDLGSYSLHSDYGEVFQSVTDELIFGRTFSAVNGHQATFINTNRVYGGYGGWGGSNCPSQNLVDAYEMANGEMIYLPDSTINLTSGYDTLNPYQGRDPRFYESILYHGSTFRGELLDYSEEISGFDGEGNPIFTGVRGNSNYKVTGDNSRTGYNMRKFIEEDTSIPVSRSLTYTQPWPFFRLAEIYLNYAEAMYELGEENIARQYIDLVRARAGMPPLASSITGDALKERIYHERRIELAFEGQRFWDVRRWEIAPEVETWDIDGMDIYKSESDESLTFFRKRIIDRPEPWDSKYYYIPIPREEINKSATLQQSPGYN